MRLTKDNYNEVLEYLAKKQHYECPICKEPFTTVKGVKLNHKLDIHHAKVHNTKWAKIHTPLLLNDETNLVLVHHSCHINNANWGRIKDGEAEALEEELKANCEHRYQNEEYDYDIDFLGIARLRGYVIFCELDNKPCEKQCCKR